MGRTRENKFTEMTSTVEVPSYKRTSGNTDFVCRILEEDIPTDDYVNPSDLESGNGGDRANTNRKLAVIDGVLTLTSGVDKQRSNLEKVYEPRMQPPVRNKKSVYMKNKIHSFLMEGRVALDTLPACRERKLDTYNLQNVCMTLMGKSKLDMSPAEIFKSYRMAVIKEPNDEDVMSVLESGLENVDSFAEDLLNRVIYYCVKDSDLVMDLFTFMNTWTTMMEYSKCFALTPYESLVCGQQARCLSIVYIMASKRGYVLDHPSSLSQDVDTFVGGRVVEPIPGVYDFVMCHDFNSLYPSIIQEKKICHTTYIPVNRWAEFKKGEYVALKEKENEGNAEFRFSLRKRGIIPDLCKFLVMKRTEAKNIMAEAGIDAELRVSMDCRQKALKITANSMYGLMGASVGALQLLEGSRSITCRGRQLQEELATALRDRFDTVEVYGDMDSSMVTGRGNMNTKRLMVTGRGNMKRLMGQAADSGMTISDPNQAFTLGRSMEHYLNGHNGEPGFFQLPIRVEMEKVMKMIVVHKKMYAYLEYRDDADPPSKDHPQDGSFDPEAFVKDRTGMPLLTSKGLLSARRDACRLCKTTFDRTVKLLLSKVSPVNILLAVAQMLREFLLSSDMDDFVKTVEVAGSYSSPSCANSVFKRNMLELGTKIEAKSRVSYVWVVTDAEKEGRSSRTGDKMLLTKYYNPVTDRIDNLQYLESGLRKSLDEVVSIGTKQFSKSVLIPGLGTFAINKPVSFILKLVTTKSFRWDIDGVNTYEQIVHREANRMDEVKTANMGK